MKHRIFCILLLVAVCAVPVKAQNKWGTEVYGGIYTLNMWSCKAPDTDPEIKLGVTEKYDIDQYFSLVSGLAAYKDNYYKTTDGVKTDIKAYFLQIPLNVRYTYPMGAQLFNSKISLEVGPYVSCGIGGKTKLSTNGAESEYDTFGGGHFHHMEAGINTAILIHCYHVICGVECRLGLTKMGYYDSNAKSKSVGVRLGYEF